MRYVVIMAGGAGTRLWPLSRQGMPKQLLRMFDGRSLLQLAFERVLGLVPPERILVCTSRDYADEVRAQLPGLQPQNLLGEPVGRDSLGAVAWSAAVLQRRDSDAVVAMVTADQLIEPEDGYREALASAFDLAETRANALVTLGVVPTSAHTGYGYLRQGELVGNGPARVVSEFREKPDAATAERYLADGNYWWNAGLFVWRCSTLLDQLGRLLPRYAEQIAQIAEQPARLDELFAQLEKNSVDYAVMEPSSQGQGAAEVVAVPLAVQWRDVGGYLSLAQEFASDGNGNRVEGCSVNVDSHGCLVINTDPERLVATIGCRDMAVVATRDTTLVAPLSETEQLKTLVERVRAEFGAHFA